MLAVSDDRIMLTSVSNPAAVDLSSFAAAPGLSDAACVNATDAAISASVFVPSASVCAVANWTTLPAVPVPVRFAGSFVKLCEIAHLLRRDDESL